MKTSFKVLIVVMFCVFFVSIGLAVYAVGVIDENKGEPIVRFYTPEDENPYLVKTYADGTLCEDDFNIITFADPHFDGVEDNQIDDAIFTIIENTLKYENPDLVVFCGDIALGALAADVVRDMGELFESYNQYWGYALGNHDAESEQGPDRAALVDVYSEFEHCVVKPVEGISGEGNCIVNVKNANGEVLQSLVFIDSGAYLDPEICEEYEFEYKDDYDFIKYDQIEWYKSEMRNIEERNGGEMPDSIMFIHIPLKEYSIAYDEALENEEIIYGAGREPECDSPYNTGMFDAIIEVGSTKAVVCGHDHINDYCVDYMGVKLLYSQSISFNSYFMRSDPLQRVVHSLGQPVQFSDGYTLFSVKKDGKMRITPKYNQDNPSLFDGLTQEQRELLFLDETLPQ